MNTYLEVQWQGKVVTVNRWHVVRRGRIAASREYEEFISALAWSIRAKTAKQYPRINLTIETRLWKMVDKQNLLKPISDAIERSGLIANDRDIMDIHMLPSEQHARGELDEITLFVEALDRSGEMA